jgi:uncharacterized membrane protein
MKKEGDTKKKSIGKTISWRIVATLTTMTLVFIFTGKLILAFEVGLIEVIVKMILYYFHERIWSRVK